MKIYALDYKKVLKEVYVISLLVCFSLALPFVFHLLPYQGSIPLGAIFLPIYYAPLIGVILFKKHTGFITAALAPVVNNLITGSPARPMIILLILEMQIFLFAYSFLTKSMDSINFSGAKTP